MKIYTWDIETRWDGGEIIVIGVYDGTTTHYFNNVKEFWQYLKEENDKGEIIYMYAHHHDYDLSGILMDEFAHENIEVDLMKTMFSRNRKVLKLRFKGLKNIEFRDSFRLFPMSLKKVTKGFECKHVKLDLEEELKKRGLDKKYKNKRDFFNKVKSDDPFLLEYLNTDLRGLHEALMKFIDITGVGVKKMITIASVAMAVFKKDYPEGFNIMVINGHGKKRKSYGKEVKKFARKSFKGGRVEVVRRKGEKVYKYDVTSLYPFVMLAFAYPAGDYRKYTGKAAKAKLNMILNSEKPRLGIFDATVVIPKTKIPPLPVRISNKKRKTDEDEEKGKLYFPVGEVREVWTSVELAHAIKKYGVKVKEVHEAWVWDDECRPFTGYVIRFFSLKNSDKVGKAVKFVAKLLLNSLFGKFGMREEGIRLVYVEDFEKNEKLKKKYKKEDLDVRLIGGKKAYVLKDRIYADYILPHISSFVTSYARLVLLEKIEELIEKGYEVFYYDTDSVHTNCPPEDFGVDIDEENRGALGLWKFEGYEEVVYYVSAKLYAGKNVTKAKGIPSDSQPSFEVFKEMVEGDAALKELFRGTRLKTLWEILTSDDRKEREVMVTKVVNLLNAKRKPINEYDTEPWDYSEISNLRIRKKEKKKPKEVVISVNGIEVRAYSEFVRLIETLFNKEESLGKAV